MKFKKTNSDDSKLDREFLAEGFFDGLPVIGYVDKGRGVTVLPVSERDEEDDTAWEELVKQVRGRKSD